MELTAETIKLIENGKIRTDLIGRNDTVATIKIDWDDRDGNHHSIEDQVIGSEGWNLGLNCENRWHHLSLCTMGKFDLNVRLCKNESTLIHSLTRAMKREYAHNATITIISAGTVEITRGIG